jgi:hypothetical protein
MNKEFIKKHNQRDVNSDRYRSDWWEIHIENPDRDDEPRIIGNIAQTAEWACVYCYREDNISRIRGLIIFPDSYSGDWLVFNICRYAEYQTSIVNPNVYRGIVINLEDVIHPNNWQMLLDSGPYYGDLG